MLDLINDLIFKCIYQSTVLPFNNQNINQNINHSINTDNISINNSDNHLTDSNSGNYNYCLWRSFLDKNKKILNVNDYDEMSKHFNECFRNNEYPREEFDCFLGIGQYDTVLNENYKEIRALYRTGDLLTKDSVDLDVFVHPIIQGAKYKGLLISPRLNYVLSIQIECSYFKDMEKIERLLNFNQ